MVSKKASVPSEHRIKHKEVALILICRDIFRCTTSLYHLIQPAYYEEMIRAVIDIWRYEGYMPDGRSGNYNGLVQGGSNADNVLADAYVKGLRGSINWTAGYQAMVKDAEVIPYNTFSIDDPTASVKEGRGALGDWIPLGYVSSDQSTRAISRTVEYALNDFALAQVARGEAPGDVEKYMNRSSFWQNIWAHNFTETETGQNFTGFLAPKLADGTFNLTDYNPALCGECEWKAISYEATPFEYSFTIPHDMQTLIQYMGGADNFERRLDYIHLPNTTQQNLGANGAGISSIMNIGYLSVPRSYIFQLTVPQQRARLRNTLRIQLHQQASQVCPARTYACQPVLPRCKLWRTWQL